MKKQIIMIGLIGAIIIVSGCTELGMLGDMFGGFFGDDVIKIKTDTEQVGKTNVISIKNVGIHPNPPLLPGSEATLSYVLTNENTDFDQTVSNIVTTLYDAPNFKNRGNELCNDAICVAENCDASSPCEIAPGAEKYIEYRMVAPNVEKSETNKAVITLSYNVKYDYETKTSFSIPVVSPREVDRRQRAGQSVTLTNSLVKSGGPVQIKAWLDGPKYMLSGQDATIVLQIEDKGKGFVEDSIILPGDFKITIPDGLCEYSDNSKCINIDGVEVFVNYDANAKTCTSFMDSCFPDTGDGDCVYENQKSCQTCSNMKEGDDYKTCTELAKCEHTTSDRCVNGLYCCVPKKNDVNDYREYDNPYFICIDGVCENRGNINLVRGRSSPVYIIIRNVPQVEVFSTETIKAQLKYRYEMRGSTKAEVATMSVGG